MKKKLLIFLTLLGLTMVMVSCKSEEVQQDRNEQTSSENDEKKVEKDNVQTEETLSLIDTVRDVIDNLNNGTWC